MANVKSFDSSSDIFNAFILPADCAEIPNKIQNIGFASADYALPQNETRAKKEYHKIFGILLDARALMEHHRKHNEREIARLAEVVMRLV